MLHDGDSANSARPGVANSPKRAVLRPIGKSMAKQIDSTPKPGRSKINCPREQYLLPAYSDLSPNQLWEINQIRPRHFLIPGNWRTKLLSAAREPPQPPPTRNASMDTEYIRLLSTRQLLSVDPLVESASP